MGVMDVVKDAVEIGKKLREVSDAIKDADTKMLIADLQLALADVKTEVAELKNENLELRDQLAEAAEMPDIRSKLELRKDMYYLKEDFEGRPEGPYCTNCFESQGDLILLTKMGEHFYMFGTHDCPACKAKFGAR